MKESLFRSHTRKSTFSTVFRIALSSYVKNSKIYIYIFFFTSVHSLSFILKLELPLGSQHDCQQQPFSILGRDSVLLSEVERRPE